MSRRALAKPNFKFHIWKQDGKCWYAESADLLNLINATGLSDEIIKSRMGHGYYHIVEALTGKRLNRWAIQHIEHGLNTAPPFKIWTPWDAV